MLTTGTVLKFGSKRKEIQLHKVNGARNRVVTLFNPIVVLKWQERLELVTVK
jgi:hypothetical protein